MSDVLTCQVCENEPAVGVGASPLGPFSMAYGPECLKQRAEQLTTIFALIESIGGLEQVATWVRRSVTSYKDGQYIGWAEIENAFRARVTA